MKEEEAKTKWCPMTRITASEGSFLDNRGEYLADQAGCCLVSECMMWKATDNECDPSTGDQEVKCYPAGYCGLTRE